MKPYFAKIVIDRYESWIIKITILDTQTELAGGYYVGEILENTVQEIILLIGLNQMV